MRTELKQIRILSQVAAPEGLIHRFAMRAAPLSLLRQWRILLFQKDTIMGPTATTYDPDEYLDRTGCSFSCFGS